MFDIIGFLIYLPGIIIALTFHEFAHGYAAYILGDDTAKAQGRLTLNPIAHIDPIGFLALLVAHFGWAKPVPFNPLNFKNRKQGTIIVAFAGPLMNVFIAIVALITFFIISTVLKYNNTALYDVIWAIYSVNLSFAVFNLIPLPPLDGSKILSSLLPNKYEYLFYKYENYSYILLLVLIFTNALNYVLLPMITIADNSIRNLITLMF